MVTEFRARRDLIVDGLNDIPGIRCLRPKGAFYAFPEISGTGLLGADLADRLIGLIPKLGDAASALYSREVTARIDIEDAA